ncbi:hypothetical protein COCVIDRAFT_116217, partial [Bipolaris victoriae FI3]
DINTPDSHVWTPISEAGFIGHHVIVHALLEAGASVSAPDASHSTPLLWAVFKGLERAISTLPDHGVDSYRADRND